MEKIEQLQQTAKEAQDKVRAAEQVYTKEKQVLDELDSRLSAELAELESQQRDRSGKVEPGLLARYTKLKAARKTSRLRRLRGACVRDVACRFLRNWSPRSNGRRISTPVPTVTACCTGTATCRATSDRTINPSRPISKWVNRFRPLPSSPLFNTLPSP